MWRCNSKLDSFKTEFSIRNIYHYPNYYQDGISRLKPSLLLIYQMCDLSKGELNKHLMEWQLASPVKYTYNRYI